MCCNIAVEWALPFQNLSYKETFYRQFSLSSLYINIANRATVQPKEATGDINFDQVITPAAYVFLVSNDEERASDESMFRRSCDDQVMHFELYVGTGSREIGQQ